MDFSYISWISLISLSLAAESARSLRLVSPDNPLEEISPEPSHGSNLDLMILAPPYTPPVIFNIISLGEDC